MSTGYVRNCQLVQKVSPIFRERMFSVPPGWLDPTKSVSASNVGRPLLGDFPAL
jgi:hypothetical protein